MAGVLQLWTGMMGTANPCTVAQLPIAPTALGNLGQRWMVNDSTLAPLGNFGTPVIGGGTNLCPVINMGASWIIG